MLKHELLYNETSCLNKAAAKEPVFLLRANDPIAAAAIEHWATMAEGHHEPEKIARARKEAQEMRDWHNHHVTKYSATLDETLERR